MGLKLLHANNFTGYFQSFISFSKMWLNFDINIHILDLLLYETFQLFNTSYLTDSYIVFTLKMESIFKNTIFSLKFMVKSDQKFILKSLHAGRWFFYYWICDFGHFYKVRKNSLPHGGISKIFFLLFLDTYSILRVKMMYESVKWVVLKKDKNEF